MKNKGGKGSWRDRAAGTEIGGKLKLDERERETL